MKMPEKKDPMDCERTPEVNDAADGLMSRRQALEGVGKKAFGLALMMGTMLVLPRKADACTCFCYGGTPACTATCADTGGGCYEACAADGCRGGCHTDGCSLSCGPNKCGNQCTQNGGCGQGCFEGVEL